MESANRDPNANESAILNAVIRMHDLNPIYEV
jgi:hypothetical protein